MKCNESLTHNEDTLECSGCNNNYHYYCIGISETNFKKMSKNTKNRYSCSTCNNSETKTINDPLLKLNTKMGDLIKSVNFMSLQFDDFNKKLESTLTELKQLKKENEIIKADNSRLSNEILEIKHKLDTIEQQNLGISVEINGIPKSNNENCIAVVQSIVKQLNINATVTEATRIILSDNKIPIIVAKLDTIDMRRDLIRANKVKKLNANMLSNNWSTDNKIYINERLTKEKRILYSKTRAAAKVSNFKFVWINNADILARKDEHSKIIRIRSSTDLNKL
jgi:hypothetical protein